ncbi:MAG: hypothetical protein ACREV5_00165 [Steroidobacter sp.]
MRILPRVRTALMLVVVLAIAACSNGRGSVEEVDRATDEGSEQPLPTPEPPPEAPPPDEPPVTPPPQEQRAYTIGGMVAGLAGSGLVLQLNGGDDLIIASNGSFTFVAEQQSGAQYRVTVRSQPADASQVCTIENASGTVGSGNVRNVRVTCARGAFSISGRVSGLMGSGLVLQNNGGDPIGIDSNGEFTFPRKLASGAQYEVTVRSHPSDLAQTCTVANGSGAIAQADITGVLVSCSTGQYAIGGEVQGLVGSGLILRNNGADDLPVNANGRFTFRSALASGGTYHVTIAQPPVNPTQVCALSNASGTVGAGNVANIRVRCESREFTVGGRVSGLIGAGLVLQNNGDDALAIAANGEFTFPASLVGGAPYNVTVLKQPESPAQTCAVSNGAGTVATSDIGNVLVICTGSGFTIGGTVTGLKSRKEIQLRNNGGDPLEVRRNGPFTFGALAPNGARYDVTVSRRGSSGDDDDDRRCRVENGRGVVAGADITDIRVICKDDDDDDDDD